MNQLTKNTPISSAKCNHLFYLVLKNQAKKKNSIFGMPSLTRKKPMASNIKLAYQSAKIHLWLGMTKINRSWRAGQARKKKCNETT